MIQRKIWETGELQEYGSQIGLFGCGHKFVFRHFRILRRRIGPVFKNGDLSLIKVAVGLHDIASLPEPEEARINAVILYGLVRRDRRLAQELFGRQLVRSQPQKNIGGEN
jgi:hypothetical protein